MYIGGYEVHNLHESTDLFTQQYRSDLLIYTHACMYVYIIYIYIHICIYIY